MLLYAIVQYSAIPEDEEEEEPVCEEEEEEPVCEEDEEEPVCEDEEEEPVCEDDEASSSSDSPSRPEEHSGKQRMNRKRVEDGQEQVFY